MLKHSWLKNAQNVAFLFGPILLTSCLCTKDTRLSARYIFAFQESLGTRLIKMRLETVWERDYKQSGNEARDKMNNNEAGEFKV